MRKFYLWFSLISLLFLGLGTHFMGSNIIFAFAASNDTAQIMRLGLAAVIISQLVTIPPRHIALRVATGLTALMTAGYGMSLFFSGYSPLLDVCAYIMVGIALGISALELSTEDYNIRAAKYAVVIRPTLLEKAPKATT